jgi:hypothetical protein
MGKNLPSGGFSTLPELRIPAIYEVTYVGTVFMQLHANTTTMDVLMVSLVFIVGFVAFGLLFYGAAKLRSRKTRDPKKNYVPRVPAGNLKYR